MSRKLHIAFPACCILVAVLLIGYFCIVSGAVDGASDASAPADFVQEVEGQETPAPETEDTVVQADDEAPVVSVYVDEDADSGYVLTEDERIAVECAVMCEAGGEGTKGQMMVAQSILDGTLRNDYDVFQTIYAYQVHSTSYDNVTDEVRESVSRVFDQGERVTQEKTDLWYNPALVESEWHEDQQYVITVGSHRFFWMNKDM